jgi:murein DD-endopeptidase MepM/ murein hydrolase activator NlpD
MIVPPYHSKPFLSLPFATATRFVVSEGWLYSAREQKIHGHDVHGAIDFASSRGTPILCAADGFAVASFQAGFSGTYRGKRVGYGLGHFVQVWHPDRRIYTVYGHLEEISVAIPALAAERVGEEWNPVGLHIPTTTLVSLAVPVRRGQCIGAMGDSGLSWGYTETPDSRVDPSQYSSWDEVHLHFEVYDRRSLSYQKQNRWDPFGLYDNRSAYRSLRSASEGLWLLDKEGMPECAA